MTHKWSEDEKKVAFNAPEKLTLTTLAREVGCAVVPPFTFTVE